LQWSDIIQQSKFFLIHFFWRYKYMETYKLQGLGRCGAPMYGLGNDPFNAGGTFLPGGNLLSSQTGSGSGVTTGTERGERSGVTTGTTRPPQSDQPDSDCPCEITEVIQNKTVTIPVKSQKIVCKPTTVKEGVVDCETIQAALRNLPGSGGAAGGASNPAGNPSNLLGLGDIGLSIDFLSLAIGGAIGYVAAKYI
jgi:hypothetical protein